MSTSIREWVENHLWETALSQPVTHIKPSKETIMTDTNNPISNALKNALNESEKTSRTDKNPIADALKNATPEEILNALKAMSEGTSEQEKTPQRIDTLLKDLDLDLDLDFTPKQCTKPSALLHTPAPSRGDTQCLLP